MSARLDLYLIELRHALRELVTARTYSLVAIACLSLGIGAVGAIYPLFHAVILSPFPFAEPERIAHVELVQRGEHKLGVDARISLREEHWEWFEANQELFDDPAFFGFRSFAIYTDADAFELNGAIASPDYMPLVGMRTALGRPLSQEDGDTSVVVLSDRAWRESFGADPAIIGRALTVDGEPHTVVGVLAPDQQYPPQTRMFVPMHARYLDRDGVAGANYDIVGRLRDGQSMAQLNDRLLVLSDQARETMPAPFSGYRLHAADINERNGSADTRFAMKFLLAAVVALIAIAMTNVINLLLTRVVQQEGRLAVRAALGGGRSAMIRPLAIELAILGIVGTALGLALAALLTPMLVARMDLMIPNPERVRVDWAMLAITCGVALASLAMVLLIPAWRARRIRLSSALQQQGYRGLSGGNDHLRQGLIATEVAGACALLIGAALMIQSFREIASLELGFQTERVFTAAVTMPPDDGSDVSPYSFYAPLVDALESLPEVELAAIAHNAGAFDRNFLSRLSIEDFPPENPQDTIQPFPFVNTASANFFSILGVPVLEGREFDRGDRPGSEPVVIINEVMARTHWPDQSPLGKRMKRYYYDGTDYPWMRIVGVVGNMRGLGNQLTDAPSPGYWMAFGQDPIDARDRDLRLMVKTTVPVADAVAAIRQTVRDYSPLAVVSNEWSMQQRIDNLTQAERARMILVSLLAAIGTLLAAMGIFGVVSFSVEQRRRELSLHMALGAGPVRAIGRVLRSALLPAAAGLAAGMLAIALFGAPVVGELHGASLFEPALYGLIALMVLVTTMVATLLPALSTVRRPPMEALRV